MAHWNHTIDIAFEWEQAEDDVITIKSLIEVIKTRFSALPQHLQNEAAEYLTEFSDLVSITPENEDLDREDFDVIWNDLYNWADANRVWIKTIA